MSTFWIDQYFRARSPLIPYSNSNKCVSGGIMSLRRLILSVFIFTFAFITCSHAQTGTGSLSGQVTDQNDKAVEGATVKLIDPSTKNFRDTKTDSNGSYSFSQVRPGTYKLQIEAPNFKTYAQDKVEVLISTPTTA